ncbi:MAG TPA: hypothetical protein VMJ70_13835 [Candidatus Sulfotelmatobacter sp.]|nr:hypothetical protein [Candidatus Sulfotelmatobacter sp.]
MNKLVRGVLLIAVMLLISLGVSFAGVIVAPTGIPYQGRLTDAGGAPVNGAKTLTLTLYNSGNTVIYQETQNVTVTNGLFSVEIGTGTAVTGTFATINFSTYDLYLGIQVGTDPEMAPKIHFGVVPYAMTAKDSPGLASNHSTSFTNFPTTGAAVALVGATITVPTAGYIMVIAGGQIYAPAGFSTAMWISEAAGGSFDSNDYGDVSNPNGAQFFQYERHRVYSKGPGTYTFYLNGSATVAGAYLWQPTMTAFFIPTAMGSVAPVPTVPAAARQPADPTR